MVSVLPSETECIRDVPIISHLVSGVPPPNRDEEERESIGERSVATVALLICSASPCRYDEDKVSRPKWELLSRRVRRRTIAKITVGLRE